MSPMSRHAPRDTLLVPLPSDSRVLRSAPRSSFSRGNHGQQGQGRFEELEDRGEQTPEGGSFFAVVGLSLSPLTLDRGVPERIATFG